MFPFRRRRSAVHRSTHRVPQGFTLLGEFDCGCYLQSFPHDFLLHAFTTEYPFGDIPPVSYCGFTASIDAETT